jgi:hypothetical protein
MEAFVLLPVELPPWMEKPVAWNFQKPSVELTSTKESGPVNSVSSMKPKL